MSRVLSFFDSLQPGSLKSVIMGVAAIAILVAFALLDTGDRYHAYLFSIMIGSLFTWRHYTVWHRRREQGGVELMGTERDIDELYPYVR